MIRSVLLCLALIYLQAPPAGAADSSPTRDMHVWRAEYEHALSATGGGLDDAACLMMSGDPARALDALGESPDQLRRGLLAFKAGSYRQAVDLLLEEQENPYLESLRLFCRSSSFLKMGLYEEAAAGAAAILRDPACQNESSMRSKSEELLLEAVLSLDTEMDHVIELIGPVETLSSRSSLLLAALLVERGRDEEAVDPFLEGIESAPDSLTDGICSRLIEHYSQSTSALTSNDIFRALDAAADHGMHREARLLLELAAERHPGDYRLELAMGRMHRVDGKRKKALHVLTDLFRSHAPVDIKKEALLMIASIEYDRGRHDAAAENYRLFGLYYPSDERSASSLDLAARLFVSTGNYPDALQTWARLRERGVRGRISGEAALSESALRCMLGQLDGSHSILNALLSGADGRDRAAILYWLGRTSKTESERAAWNARLEGEYPMSFYALASREGNGAFRLATDRAEASDELVQRLEQREREFVERVCRDLEPGPSLIGDPAYRALQYLLGRGFVEEARICVMELKERFGFDSAAMAALYATVRSSGLVDLGLKLLWTPGLSKNEDVRDASLRYPIAYSASVSDAAVEYGLPVDLVFAVIREESSFDRYAVSRAGALGLMQLMPRTGAWIGKKIEGESYTRTDLLTPAKNIAAGSWYLRYLLDRSDHSIVASLASYNGGETRLGGWKKTFGPAADPVLAVELIGPMETRRYVKRVLDSMTAYAMLPSGERAGE
jgi:soluble lytic murein transglycosylase